jgi:hypothetical protein
MAAHHGGRGPFSGLQLLGRFEREGGDGAAPRRSRPFLLAHLAAKRKQRVAEPWHHRLLPAAEGQSPSDLPLARSEERFGRLEIPARRDGLP